jgi:hypothetical protein
MRNRSMLASSVTKENLGALPKHRTTRRSGFIMQKRLHAST